VNRTTFAAVLGILLIYPVLSYPQEKRTEGCICRIDESKQTLTVIPWNDKEKLWNTETPAVFVYADSSEVTGENSLRFGDLKRGRPLKTSHLKEVGKDKKGAVKIVGEPYQISEPAKLVGRRASVVWKESKKDRVIVKAKLIAFFRGEELPVTIDVSSSGSYATIVGSDDCQCGAK
jgi:hypothetical protein